MERKETLIKKKYIEYFISTLAMSGSTAITSIVDMIMVGNIIGSNAMAAIGLTAPIIFIINVIFGLYIYGGNTLSVTYKGCRDSESADKCFTIAIWGGILACALVSLSELILFSSVAKVLCVGNEELYDPVSEYLFPLLFTGPLVILVNGMAVFVRSDGLGRLSLAIPIVSNAINLIMDYVFMGLFGFGIGSAAWATNIGFISAIILVFPYLRSEKRTAFFNMRGLLDIKLTLDIFKTGLATALLNASLLFKSYITNIIVVSLFGASGAVTMSVCLSGGNIANVLYLGTSQTMMPIGGALFGEKDYTGIRYLLRVAASITVTICTVIAALLCIFPYQFAQIFNVDVESIKNLYYSAFRIYCFSLPFVGIQNIVRSYLQACGHKNAATVMMILDGTAFFIPIIYVLSVAAPSMIWITYTAAPILAMAAVYIYLYISLKKEGMNDLFLLPVNTGNNAELELTLKGDLKDVSESSEIALAFCRENGIPDSVGNLIWLSVQEICSNIAKYAYSGKTGSADLFLKITDTEVIMRIRDNGIIFNPVKFIDESNNEITGLKLLEAMKIKLEYNRILGFNNTIVTIPCAGQNKSA